MILSVMLALRLRFQTYLENEMWWKVQTQVEGPTLMCGLRHSFLEDVESGCSASCAGTRWLYKFQLGRTCKVALGHDNDGQADSVLLVASVAHAPTFRGRKYLSMRWFILANCRSQSFIHTMLVANSFEQPDLAILPDPLKNEALSIGSTLRSNPSI